MQTIEQTLQQKLAEIVVWERDYMPTNLAQTAFNRDLIQKFLAEKHGGFITVATLNHCLEALKNELQWIATPAPATTPAPPPATQVRDLWSGLVLRGSAKDKLYQMGISVSPHLSYSERMELEAADDQKRKDRQNAVVIRNERAALKKEWSDAQLLTLYQSSGRVDYAATEREKAKAISAVKSKVEAFNRRVPAEQRIEV